jgi:hypothetical protein
LKHTQTRKKQGTKSLQQQQCNIKRILVEKDSAKDCTLVVKAVMAGYCYFIHETNPNLAYFLMGTAITDAIPAACRIACKEKEPEKIFKNLRRALFSGVLCCYGPFQENLFIY